MRSPASAKKSSPPLTWRESSVAPRHGAVAEPEIISPPMMLAASPGSELTLKIDGNDELEVLEAIRQLVDNNFGEE